jgi:hypothetical protein
MLVLIAHDLIAWPQRLLMTGELARCEPKRLRYRLLHIAARLSFHARKQRCASTPHGPGHKRSPTRSPAPERSRRPPERAAGAHDYKQRPRRPAQRTAAHAQHPAPAAAPAGTAETSAAVTRAAHNHSRTHFTPRTPQ